MTEYIKKEDARRAIEHYDPAFCFCIEYIPAADVVEVCRCRDCKWTDNVLFKNKVIWCDHDEQWVEEDNFCKYGSRGERRSE